MKLDIKIDDKKLVQAMLKLPDQVSKTIRVEMKSQLQDVAEYASAHHKYNTQSGMLERANIAKVDRSGLTGKVYLNNKDVPYARRIHEGGGGKRNSLGRRMTNKPDQYLYEALRVKTKEIESGMVDAVDRAIKKAGL